MFLALKGRQCNEARMGQTWAVCGSLKEGHQKNEISIGVGGSDYSGRLRRREGLQYWWEQTNEA